MSFHEKCLMKGEKHKNITVFFNMTDY